MLTIGWTGTVQGLGSWKLDGLEASGYRPFFSAVGSGPNWDGTTPMVRGRKLRVAVLICRIQRQDVLAT